MVYDSYLNYNSVYLFSYGLFSFMFLNILFKGMIDGVVKCLVDNVVCN